MAAVCSHNNGGWERRWPCTRAGYGDGGMGGGMSGPHLSESTTTDSSTNIRFFRFLARLSNGALPPLRRFEDPSVSSWSDCMRDMLERAPSGQEEGCTSAQAACKHVASMPAGSHMRGRRSTAMLERFAMREYERQPNHPRGGEVENNKEWGGGGGMQHLSHAQVISIIAYLLPLPNKVT